MKILKVFENFEIRKCRSKIFLSFFNFCYFRKLCERSFQTSYWTPSNSFWSQRTRYLNRQTSILNPGKSAHLLGNISLISLRSWWNFPKFGGRPHLPWFIGQHGWPFDQKKNDWTLVSAMHTNFLPNFTKTTTLRKRKKLGAGEKHLTPERSNIKVFFVTCWATGPLKSEPDLVYQRSA